MANMVWPISYVAHTITGSNIGSYNIVKGIFLKYKGAFCPAGEPKIRTKKCDLTNQPCGDCYDRYDKCSDISTLYCDDVRYAANMERLCKKHCNKCSSRKRRRRRRIQEEESSAYQALDELLLIQK